MTVAFRGIVALHGINLHLGGAEALGVVGESGCGKSVTWLAALGLLPRLAAVAGSVTLASAELLNQSAATLDRVRGGRIAMIFQDPASPLNPVQRIGPPVGFGGHWAHALGTDELGRDVLSRLIVSIRISLLIAMGATVIGTVLGTTLGLLAAQFRGWVEQGVLMLIDFQAALPFLIMALAVLAFFGNALPLFIGLMGFYGWERHARIARGLAIAAGGQGYAASVRQLGAEPLRVYGHHVLPNIASTLIVSATLSCPEIILLESGLSFLGLGVQPPLTSLGNMVGYARDYLQRAPWIMLSPGAVIVLTTLCIGVVGDWLRDRLDPTLE